MPSEAWLHRIAVTTAISYRRREKIRSLPSLLLRLGAPQSEPDPIDHAHSRSVLAELRRLPPKQAAAVVLRYYRGYTNLDIAAALGVSERTVGNRLAGALLAFRQWLEAGSPSGVWSTSRRWRILSATPRAGAGIGLKS